MPLPGRVSLGSAPRVLGRRQPRLVRLTRAQSGAAPPAPTEVPGYSRSGLLGWLPALKGDPAGFILAYSRVNASLGHTTSLSLGPLSCIFTTDPALVNYVLAENASNYCKSDVDKEGVGLITGNGLLFLEGKMHRERRLQMQPLFSGGMREEVWVDAMGEVAEEVVEGWRGAGGAQEVAMGPEMLRTAMRVVGATVLQRADLSTTFADVLGALPPSLEIVIENLRSRPFAWPFWFPSRENRRLWGELATLDGGMQEVLNARLPEDMAAAAMADPDAPLKYTAEMAGVPASDLDLLDLLLLSTTEGGRQLSHREITDELKTLVLAGSETTANALAWGIDLLASDPEVFAALQEEVRGVVGTEGGVRHEHIRRLKYTECVVKEVLRLRPPAWLFDRQALSDDVLPGGAVIKKGQYLIVSPLALGADARWYGEDAELFRPGRWAGEGLPGGAGGGDLPRTAFIPFGAGFRSCIGSGIALLEMTVVLATVALRCESLARPAGAEAPRMDALVTLRPTTDVPVVVEFLGGE